MQTGIYVLTSTVQNPVGDNRVRHDYWRRPVWKAGDRFVVEDGDNYIELPDLKVIRPLRGYDWRVISPKQTVLLPLLPHLQLVPEEDLETVLLAAKELQRVDAKEILQHLLNVEALSLATIKATVLDVAHARTPNAERKAADD